MLLDKPHGKEVDIWGLGVIAYLLITGYLPFDDNSDLEIKRKTIHMELKFHKELWSDKSDEAKQFVFGKLLLYTN